MQPRFVDCRPRDAYRAGHIPGAAHADPEHDLTGDVGGGRHPLPSADAFAAWASAAGIGPDTLVVGYDDGTGWAARLWWLLRHFGHDAAAVIPLAAWHGPLSTDVEEIAPATFVPHARTDDTADADELLRRLEDRNADARRRQGAGALARRDGADRSGRGPYPGREKPLFPGRVAAARRPTGRARPRRLLRIRRHGLRRPARAASRRAEGRTPLSRLVQRVVCAGAGRTRLSVSASWCARWAEIPFRCARTSSWSVSSSSTSGSTRTSRSRSRAGRPSVNA